ncbi:unnamed protein product [Sphagnum balticum]
MPQGSSSSSLPSSPEVDIVIFPNALCLGQIEEHPLLKLKLKDMENQSAAIARKIERKETRTFVVKNEIYQLLTFYVVFQGVVLTAVAQASALKCRHWWAPFTLSLIASAMTFVGVYQKLETFRQVKDDFENERFNSSALIRDIQLFKMKGKTFSFVNDVTYGTRQAKRRKGFRRLCELVFSLNFIVFVSLLGFSVVILVACKVILCM